METTRVSSCQDEKHRTVDEEVTLIRVGVEGVDVGFNGDPLAPAKKVWSFG